MSNAKHTPGPWFIDHSMKRFAEPGHIAISAANHAVLAQVVVRMDDEDEDSGWLLANAHLIAAAPELLEALQRLSDQCERLRLSGQKETDAERKARAAIAKATGEQA